MPSEAAKKRSHVTWSTADNAREGQVKAARADAGGNETDGRYTKDEQRNEGAREERESKGNEGDEGNKNPRCEGNGGEEEAGLCFDSTSWTAGADDEEAGEARVEEGNKFDNAAQESEEGVTDKARPVNRGARSG